MAWWGWLLLAYLPVSALLAVWLGRAIDLAERRETRRCRSAPSGLPFELKLGLATALDLVAPQQAERDAGLSGDGVASQIG